LYGRTNRSHDLDGFRHALDVLVVPPARQRHPFVERHPPVVEMLLGEGNLSPAGPSGVGYGGQASATRRITHPGGDDPSRGDEHAGLLVQLAYGPLFQALARLETPGRRFPGARGTQEQEHASIVANGQNTGDQIRLQSKPAREISILPTIRLV
jgi:hypothetical protein